MVLSESNIGGKSVEAAWSDKVHDLEVENNKLTADLDEANLIIEDLHKAHEEGYEQVLERLAARANQCQKLTADNEALRAAWWCHKCKKIADDDCDAGSHPWEPVKEYIPKLTAQVDGQFRHLRELQNAVLGDDAPTSTGHSQRQALEKAKQLTASLEASHKLSQETLIANTELVMRLEESYMDGWTDGNAHKAYAPKEHKEAIEKDWDESNTKLWLDGNAQ